MTEDRPEGISFRGRPPALQAARISTVCKLMILWKQKECSWSDETVLSSWRGRCNSCHVELSRTARSGRRFFSCVGSLSRYTSRAYVEIFSGMQRFVHGPDARSLACIVFSFEYCSHRIRADNVSHRD